MSDKQFFLGLVPLAIVSMLVGVFLGSFGADDKTVVVPAQTRTHGLIAQPNLSSTESYPDRGMTVTCEAFSNRKLNFKTGAKPGDVVATFCTATKYRKGPIG